jgi:hypothetical protein
MNKKALIIYYVLLLCFFGLTSLPSPYTRIIYGQYGAIVWSIIILMVVLPIYLLVLTIYGLIAKEFKSVLLILLFTIMVLCILHFGFGKLNL